MRNDPRLSLLAIAALSIAVLAHARSAEVFGAARGASPGVFASASLAIPLSGALPRATGDGPRLRDGLEKRAERVSAQTRANAERRLLAAIARVDEIAKEADGMVGKRIATEVGASVSALSEEKSALGASWGELLLAHLLSANARASVSPVQLVRWHHEGTPWSTLTAGLGLAIYPTVNAMDEEARVACGTARPDGRLAAIYGEGARGAAPGLDVGPGEVVSHSVLENGTGTGSELKIGH